MNPKHNESAIGKTFFSQLEVINKKLFKERGLISSLFKTYK
tara:strand:+ start:382 stop:504 length:123 start_codon:yes stop_codon:yes gene_type:complete